MSRELDAKIAEHVMCYVRTDKNMGNHNFTLNGSLVHDVDIPHYSTNIADAWTVVEKMEADGYTWDFNSYKEWTIKIANYSDETKNLYGALEERASLKDVPLAIAKASLKAMGVEV